MSKNAKISINPFADYSKASDAKKKSIIKQQKNPSKFHIAWYQLPKARIKKSISKNGDLIPVNDGIAELKARNPVKKRQVLDRTVSIEALRRYTAMILPKLLYTQKLEIIKSVSTKSIIIDGVQILVSPDVIYRTTINGQSYLGAVKIHISKNNVFEMQQSRYISTLIFEYLKETVANEDDIVLKELCLSIDIFGQSIVPTPNNSLRLLKEVKEICSEIKYQWNAA